jgi:hypothetical protein
MEMSVTFKVIIYCLLLVTVLLSLSLLKRKNDLG